MNKETANQIFLAGKLTKIRLSKSLQSSWQRGSRCPNKESKAEGVPKAEGVLNLGKGDGLTPEHRAESVEAKKLHAEEPQKGNCPSNKESKAEGVSETKGVFNLRKGDDLTPELRAESVEVKKLHAEEPRKGNCPSNKESKAEGVPEAEGVFNLRKGDDLTLEHLAESVETKEPAAKEPQKLPGNCPSDTTLLKAEGIEKTTSGTGPSGQYISQHQMSQLQELAKEEEEASKLLMNLAQKMSSVLEDVRGPIEKCIKRSLSVEMAGFIMSVVMTLLIGIAVYLFIFLNDSEPVEITATTWWEKFTSLAKNYVYFFK